MKETVIELAMRSESSVLILGPTGSGKTTLARQIHDRSSRAGKPFVAVNLACVHEGTIESELFGHEKGAFTGADGRRIGRLEMAQGGTVFLDEIGELSLRLQARLLEFLHSKTIIPVGGNRERRLDVRIIAATHRDLSSAVRAGAFREDLFHRLRVLSIDLQSLSERDEAEFDAIVHRCLEEACAAAGKKVFRISEEVARRLEAYPWPGNLRELRNVLEYCVLSSKDGKIEASDLPPWFKIPASMLAGASAVPAENTEPLPTLGRAELELPLDATRALSDFERLYLRKALDRFRWRVNRTARAIGMSKTTLIRRMRTYKLQPAD